MTGKIKRIGGDSVLTSKEVEEIASGSESSTTSTAGSTYVSGTPKFFGHTGTRSFCPLTPEEERKIKEELNPLASAIALYNSDESCSEFPMNEFVCLVVELEEARNSRKV